jgi:hypothetical protein
MKRIVKVSIAVIVGSQLAAAGCLPALDPDAALGTELQTIVSAASGDFAWDPDSGFGFAVALSATTLVVGAPFAGGPGVGAVFVFEREGARWVPLQKLNPPEPREHSFGYSVALDGDILIVGAPRARLPPAPVPAIRGAAYAFERTGDGWVPRGELISGQFAPSERYGLSVAVSGSTVLVGGGGAYVFVAHRERGTSGWLLQQQLDPAGPLRALQFGDAVALAGDLAIVGAPYATSSDRMTGRGAAWVFDRTGTAWSAVDVLTAEADARDGDLFGSAVAVAAGHILVGAPWATIGDVPYAGKAFLFSNDGVRWRLLQRLTAVSSLRGGYFGSSAALGGEFALAGAPGSTNFAGIGANGAFAYSFQRSGDAWSPRAFLPGSNRSRSDRFGWASAVAGDLAAVGAPGYLEGAGAVHLFAMRRLGAAMRGD